MSERERAMKMIEDLPEDKLVFIIAYLDGLYDGLPETPNDETAAAIKENDDALENGNSKKYHGKAHDIFAEVLGDDYA